MTVEQVVELVEKLGLPALVVAVVQFVTASLRDRGKQKSDVGQLEWMTSEVVEAVASKDPTIRQAVDERCRTLVFKQVFGAYVEGTSRDALWLFFDHHRAKYSVQQVALARTFLRWNGNHFEFTNRYARLSKYLFKLLGYIVPVFTFLSWGALILLSIAQAPLASRLLYSLASPIFTFTWIFVVDQERYNDIAKELVDWSRNNMTSWSEQGEDKSEQTSKERVVGN